MGILKESFLVVVLEILEALRDVVEADQGQEHLDRDPDHLIILTARNDKIIQDLLQPEEDSLDLLQEEGVTHHLDQGMTKASVLEGDIRKREQAQ